MIINFGGIEANVYTIGDQTILEYNDNKVLFQDIINFINSPMSTTFLTDKIRIQDLGDTIKIGCLEDTKINFSKLFKIIKDGKR